MFSGLIFVITKYREFFRFAADTDVKGVDVRMGIGFIFELFECLWIWFKAVAMCFRECFKKCKGIIPNICSNVKQDWLFNIAKDIHQYIRNKPVFT